MPPASRHAAKQGPSSSVARQRARVQQTYGGQVRAALSSGRRPREESSDEEEGEEEDEEEEGEEEEEEEEEGDEEDGAASEGESDGSGNGQLWQLPLPYKKLQVSNRMKEQAAKMDAEDIKRKANDLVRYVLFSEHRRAAIRRDDISKKVLEKEYQKIFPVIYNRAQKILRFTFGYELKELRARGADNEQIVAAQSQRKRAPANDEDGEEGGGPKGAGTKAYVLVSILPPKLVSRITRPNPSLREVFEEEDDTIERDESGVLLDWQRAGSEMGSTGLTYLLLSWILLHERNLPDDQLRSYLRRFSLEPDTPLPHSLQPSRVASSKPGEEVMTIEDFLTLLLKQNYLERILVPTAQTTSTGREASLSGRRTQARGHVKRKRQYQGDDDVLEAYEWRWGARAEAEISENSVADFVADIFMSVDGDENYDTLAPSDVENDDGEDSEGDEGTGGPGAQRKRRKKALLADIEGAAGGALIV